MDKQAANNESALELQTTNAGTVLTLNLKIGKGIGGQVYPIVILSTSADPINITMHLPFTIIELKNHFDDLRFALLFTSKRPPKTRSKRERSLQDVGEKLFNALISDQVRILYDELLQQSSVLSGTQLSIRLDIEDPELSTLPWELLYDSRISTYVCLLKNVLITRYTQSAEHIAPLQVRLPLHILAIIADPYDLDPIDREHQKGLLEEALRELKRKGLVEIHWQEKRTWKALQQRLQDKQELPCHILHFIGHGRYDPQGSAEGKIAFVTEKGETEEIDASRVADLLKNHSSLRMAVLGASEGASNNELDVFSNTAMTLVSNGVPAVLNIPYKQTDYVTKVFYQTFYEALLQDFYADKAVTKARQALHATDENSLAFGASALYASSPDGVLFDVAQRQKRKYFKLDWHLIIFILSLILFACAFLLFILGFFIQLLSSWTNNLIGFLGLVGILYTILSFFGFVPTPLKLTRLHLSKAPFISLLRCIWPSYKSSRRWFLTGAAMGAGLLTIVEIAGYNVLKNLPRALPTSNFVGSHKLGNILREYQENVIINAIACGPKNTYIAIADAHGEVHLWDWQETSSSDEATPTEKIPFVGHSSEGVNTVAWFPDGTKLVSGGNDKTVQIWNFATSTRISTYNGHLGSVLTVACSPDGKYLASGSIDSTVHILDAGTGKHLYTYSKHREAVTAVSWSSDSKRVASGSADKTVHIWEALTGKPLAINTLHHAGISSVAWSPLSNDNRIASASYDGETAVIIWDAISGKLIYPYPYVQEGGATSVAWSPKGKQIVCGAQYSGARILDATDNRILFPYSGHGSSITLVTWSNDGLQIASVEDQYTVEVWQAV